VAMRDFKLLTALPGLAWNSNPGPIYDGGATDKVILSLIIS